METEPFGFRDKNLKIYDFHFKYCRYNGSGRGEINSQVDSEKSTARDQVKKLLIAQGDLTDRNALENMKIKLAAISLQLEDYRKDT